MDADDLAGQCPICRETHPGGSCTALHQFSIVLLEIDDFTPLEAVRAAEAALVRAADEMTRWVN
jgi:hypothetical protein